MTQEMAQKVWLELKAAAKLARLSWPTLVQAAKDATAHIPHPETREAAQIRHIYGLIRENGAAEVRAS